MGIETAKLTNKLDLDRCPHCGVDKPHLSVQWGNQTTAHDGTSVRYWKAYTCGSCGGVVTAWSILERGSIFETFPPISGVSQELPVKAREYLRQAKDSFNNPAGAVMLSASAVDAMLKAKDLKEGSLYKRIDKAASDHILTPEMAQWAHEVRLDANDERHADDDAPLPTAADARKTVEFAVALGEILFVLPSRVKRGITDAKKAI